MPASGFRKHLTSIVCDTQGLVTAAQVSAIGADPGNRKGNIIALKRVFETSDFYGQVHLDLAERVYQSWEKTERNEKLERVLNISQKVVLRFQIKGFIQWVRMRDFAELETSFRKLKSYTLRLLKENKALTSSLPKKIVVETSEQHKVPAHVYAQSTSVRREIMTQPEHLPVSMSLQNSVSSVPSKSDDKQSMLYERLYQEAAKRELVSNRIRLMKEERERQETPFKPNLNSSASVNDIPVFDRLTSFTPKMTYQEKERMKRDREMQDCTFTPKLSTQSQNGSISRSNSFERLYTDAEVKRQNQRTQEKASHQRSMEECTFRPTVLQASEDTENKVFDKLYSVRNIQSYRTQLRRRQDREAERSSQVSRECTFTPKLTATPTSQSVDDGQSAHERLYQERERHKIRLEELKAKVEQEAVAKLDRSRSIPPRKRSDQPSPARFQKLYEDASRLQEKRIQQSNTVPEKAKPGPAEKAQTSAPEKPMRHGDLVKAIYEELVSKA